MLFQIKLLLELRPANSHYLVELLLTILVEFILPKEYLLYQISLCRVLAFLQLNQYLQTRFQIQSHPLFLPLKVLLGSINEGFKYQIHLAFPPLCILVALSLSSKLKNLYGTQIESKLDPPFQNL